MRMCQPLSTITEFSQAFVIRFVLICRSRRTRHITLRTLPVKSGYKPQWHQDMLAATVPHGTRQSSPQRTSFLYLWSQFVTSKLTKASGGNRTRVSSRVLTGYTGTVRRQLSPAYAARRLSSPLDHARLKTATDAVSNPYPPRLHDSRPYKSLSTSESANADSRRVASQYHCRRITNHPPSHVPTHPRPAFRVSHSQPATPQWR